MRVRFYVFFVLMTYDQKNRLGFVSVFVLAWAFCSEAYVMRHLFDLQQGVWMALERFIIV